MTYSYSVEDRLEHPGNYMYTPFEGASFLREYVDARARGRDVLVPALGSTLDLSAVASGRPLIAALVGRRHQLRQADRTLIDEVDRAARTRAPALTQTALPSRHAEADTTQLLEALVYALSADPVRSDEDTDFWVARLVVRFEVTKRIWSRYEAGLRGGSGSNDDLRLYCLVALVFGLHHGHTGRLTDLNALLKMNDLLVSVAPRIEGCGAFSMTIAYLALAYEQIAVVELMEKGRLAGHVAG